MSPGYKPGDRVGAILSSTSEVVRLLGYGVYAGDFVPPVGPFGISWEEFEKASPKAIERPKNPKLELDNGRVVWGMECWWGPEDEVREAISDREVIEVTLDEYPGIGP